MKNDIARQALRLAAGMFGAAVIAAAVAAVAEPYAVNFRGYCAALALHLWQLVRLDLGVSVISGEPVLRELADHLPSSLWLVAMGSLTALLVGVPFGLLFALGLVRRTAAPLIQIITATPVFCAGLALAYIAVHVLGWPVSVNSPVGEEVPASAAFQIALLPVLTVGLAGAAAVQLALRRAAIQSSGEGFRPGLKRMGLGTAEIEVLYVLPQVFAGLLARAGEIMLALLSATVVAEWVFHREGAADLFVKSVGLADWNMAAGLLLVFALATLIAGFAGRIAARLLAPGMTP